jgi:hypothetical protein
MIVVVMGYEDVTKLPVAGGQRLLDRIGIGHINHGRRTTCGIMYKIGVVVIQAGDCDNLKGHGVFLFSE